VQNWRKTGAKLIPMVTQRPRLRKYDARKFNLIKLMTLHGKSLSKLTKVQPYQSSPAIIPPVLLFPSFPLFLSTVHTHFIYFTILYSLRLLWLSKFFYKYPSIPLPQYITCTSCLRGGAPFVSPPFQIQTVLCIVVKPLLFAYTLTQPSHSTVALPSGFLSLVTRELEPLSLWYFFLR